MVQTAQKIRYMSMSNFPGADKGYCGRVHISAVAQRNCLTLDSTFKMEAELPSNLTSLFPCLSILLAVRYLRRTRKEGKLNWKLNVESFPRKREFLLTLSSIPDSPASLCICASERWCKVSEGQAKKLNLGTFLAEDQLQLGAPPSPSSYFLQSSFYFILPNFNLLCFPSIFVYLLQSSLYTDFLFQFLTNNISSN